MFRRPRFTRKHLWFALILTIVWTVGTLHWQHTNAPGADSRIVIASAVNFQAEVDRMNEGRNILLYVCAGAICDEQRATMETIADLYKDRLTVMQVTHESFPELIDPIKNIVSQELGIVAYPMYVLMPSDQSTPTGTAGALNVAQLSRFINNVIGSAQPEAGTNEPGTETGSETAQPVMPQLGNVHTLTQENAQSIMAQAQEHEAVYTIWCASSDALCMLQLNVLDQVAANHQEVLFVWIDSSANLDGLAQMSQQLMGGQIATPAHIISTPAGTLPLIGFLPAEMIERAIVVAAEPSTFSGATESPAPDNTGDGGR